MIVVDTSVVIEVLLATSAAWSIERRLRRAEMSLHAPQLLDIEVLQVLRRLCAHKEITVDRGHAALEDFLVLPITRNGHGSLVSRIWALRQNMTAYDAAYVALAEALEVPLITRDRRLGNAPGHTAQIEVM